MNKTKKNELQPQWAIFDPTSVRYPYTCLRENRAEVARVVEQLNKNWPDKNPKYSVAKVIVQPVLLGGKAPRPPWSQPRARSRSQGPH